MGWCRSKLEAVIGLLPDRSAVRIFGILRSKRAAAAQLGREIIGCGDGGHLGYRPRRRAPMDVGQRDHEHGQQGNHRDCAPEIRAIYLLRLQLLLNMVTLPGW